MTAPTTHSEHPPRYGLQITRGDQGEDAVVRFDGALELATAAHARNEVHRALATGCERIVIDLRALDFLDSAGIRALVDAHDRCRTSERSLTLLLDHGAVHRILAACGVLGLVEHVMPEAVAA